mmetsp:Transcript_17126/g.43053  ORF Transcript_17126/g.43053 Transcript_17126/m.43053 type:complete len:90 (-) Transcript_17126:220-489(-)
MRSQRPGGLPAQSLMPARRSAKALYARLLSAFSNGQPDGHHAVVMAPELVVHSEWLLQLMRRQIEVCWCVSVQQCRSCHRTHSVAAPRT